MSLSESRRIDPQVRIGHVHLKVADLERALEFYCGVLGFELTQRYGTQAAFISAGGYHHHIGVQTWRADHLDMEGVQLSGRVHHALLPPPGAGGPVPPGHPLPHPNPDLHLRIAAQVDSRVTVVSQRSWSQRSPLP